MFHDISLMDLEIMTSKKLYTDTYIKTAFACFATQQNDVLLSSALIMKMCFPLKAFSVLMPWETFLMDMQLLDMSSLEFVKSSFATSNGSAFSRKYFCSDFTICTTCFEELIKLPFHRLVR